MAVFIYSPDAFAKMVAIEGERWERAQSEFGDCSFEAFKTEWYSLFESAKKHWGVETPPDMSKLGEQISDYGIDVNGNGAIYGHGGWTRYTVRVSGEILFIAAMSPRQECIEKAVAEGFRLF